MFMAKPYFLHVKAPILLVNSSIKLVKGIPSFPESKNYCNNIC
ncbi:hypothetical protein SAMN05444128_1061 [Pontibacter indicus]|uniref:Uncharacterized protein n=1 Tax=Pontibacter indicus TaxID=1317125 RepID=A0A1R3WVL3_9BACT|nr:hypothetical protein SAMN05444128_1061 [Pontibacter indicus]